MKRHGDNTKVLVAKLLQQIRGKVSFIVRFLLNFWFSNGA